MTTMSESQQQHHHPSFSSSSSGTGSGGSRALRCYAVSFLVLIGYFALSDSSSAQRKAAHLSIFNEDSQQQQLLRRQHHHHNATTTGKQQKQKNSNHGLGLGPRHPLPVVTKPDPWPPLESLITSTSATGTGGAGGAAAGGQDGNKTKKMMRIVEGVDVDWVLDFSIVGHSKTATTELAAWLSTHRQVAIPSHELYFLTHNQPAELIQRMYELSPSSPAPPLDNSNNATDGQSLQQQPYQPTPIIRGYKSPHELQRKHTFQYYERYFPNTKMIVGLRHPVKWFESFYNFNWRMGNHLPDAEVYVGDHFPGGCMFHEHLARLGKTSLHDADEYELLGRTAAENANPSNNNRLLTNPVFLYDPAQLFDSDETRSLSFRRELSDFLGLTKLLSRKKNTRVGKGSDYHYKIDVCDDRYVGLRDELVEMGRNASRWLTEYFLELPDVYFSSVDGHFEAMLAAWSVDPCETTTAAAGAIIVEEVEKEEELLQN